MLLSSDFQHHRKPGFQPGTNAQIFINQRYLGFNQGTISAPSERPVLSRPAGTRFEPRSGDLHKMPFEQFLFPIPEIEQVIPTGLNYILAFRLRTGDPYGARNLSQKSDAPESFRGKLRF